MGHFLKSTKFKVILCVLALLIGVMIYAVFLGGYTIGGIDLFKQAVAPLQRLSNSISSRVEYVLEVYSGAEQCFEENQSLREEIASLYRELAEAEAAQEELDELKAYVGIKEQHSEVSLSSPCKVTGYLANDPYGAFTIDAGKEDGIALYDPVVTEQGLVGVISELGDGTATVTTILSPDVSVAAYCSRTRDKGVVSGSLSFLQEGWCKLQYLEKEHKLKKESVILTTGENGYFPKNFIIGYVQETGMDDTGLTCYAALEPAADLPNLSQVIVITDFSGKESRDDKN